MAHEYYAIDLPGKILYPKQFNVSIRRITPVEQKYILSLSQKEQKTSQDYLNLIKPWVKFDNPEMTFEELYWFDVQYMLYRIRFTTYEKYPLTINFICQEEECGSEIAQKLNMGDLKIYTPDDLTDYTSTIELKNLGATPIRQKIVKDDILIDAFIQEKGLNADDLQTRLLLVDLCLVANGRSLNEMYELADNGTLTVEDIVEIEQWFIKNVWGVKEELLVTCPKCGKEASRGYLLSLEGFFSSI